MSVLRTLIWSLCCIGFGIFLSTFEVRGRTSLGHLEHAWNHRSSTVEKVKDVAEDTVEKVQKKVSSREAPVQRPSETHSDADKNAIDQIIAKRQQH